MSTDQGISIYMDSHFDGIKSLGSPNVIKLNPSITTSPHNHWNQRPKELQVRTSERKRAKLGANHLKIKQKITKSWNEQIMLSNFQIIAMPRDFSQKINWESWRRYVIKTTPRNQKITLHKMTNHPKHHQCGQK